MRVRSQISLTLCVGLLVLSAGCIGVLTGSEPAVFQASQASVSEQALAETDFELRDQRSPWLNETVSAAGQDRDVRIQNHVSEYELPPRVDVSSGVSFGVVVVASTPQAAIAGQALNPVGQLSHRQMIDRLAADSANLRDVQREGSTRLTVLGSDTEVVRFSAIAEQSGRDVPVYVEVMRVEHEGDFVVGIGAYPRESGDVGDQVATLFESIQH